MDQFDVSFSGNVNWKVRDQNHCENVMIFANFMALESDPDPREPNHCGSMRIMDQDPKHCMEMLNFLEMCIIL